MAAPSGRRPLGQGFIRMIPVKSQSSQLARKRISKSGPRMLNHLNNPDNGPNRCTQITRTESLRLPSLKKKRPSKPLPAGRLI